ncbi:glycosyltransferase family 4 protein [Thorsellia anophelis]|uniref:Glycosyltransferase involved in cell wall bisynthesis n=1 Tax=Thorsellia anophelis DSM 18579 TaxID=1123402 RepID=A0A1I0E051_9GAMM|nr:glycosyltransferase family 4 protein [Thorsellia anophelis]SET37673.1 Glycosyltransferase involved in cell wall bisynthesis [Thorsellia anophelis DSM 18579]
MKIGITVTKLTLSGGMERYSLDLIAALNFEGVKPYVFTRQFDSQLAESCEFIPVIIPVSKLWCKLAIHIFSFKLKRLKRKMGIGLMLGCNRNASSDIAICGGTHIGYLKIFGKNQKFWDAREITLEKQLYSNAKFIIAHSLQTKKELVNYYGILSEKIRVIYPPVNHKIFKVISAQKRNEIRRANQWEENEIVMLFPSSGHNRKGLPYIVEQMKQLPTDTNIRLVVLGKEDKRINLKNITFKSFTNDIQSLYQAADFTILASEYEPFGLVGPESVLSGTPCIFSNVIGATEVLDDYVCYKFDLKQKNSLLGLLEKIDSMKIRIQEPSKHISYPVSRSEHLNAISRECGIEFLTDGSF